MKCWGIWLVVAVVVLGAIGYLVLRGSDRFGDSDTLSQISSSTDCDELHDISDEAEQDIAANRNQREFEQAVGYFNAANDRIKELGC